MPGHEISRQPVQFGRIPGDDLAQIRTDVAAEILADDRQLVVQLLNTLSGRFVFVDAGEPEVAKRPLHVMPGFGVHVAHVERGDGIVRAAMQRQLGAQRADFLRNGLGRSTHRLVGMHHLNQPRLRSDRIEFEKHVVERTQRVVDRPRRLHRDQTIESFASPGHARFGHAFERLRVRDARPKRGTGRAADVAGRCRGRLRSRFRCARRRVGREVPARTGDGGSRTVSRPDKSGRQQRGEHARLARFHEHLV